MAVHLLETDTEELKILNMDKNKKNQLYLIWVVSTVAWVGKKIALVRRVCPRQIQILPFFW